jgi:hypothetical protein
VTIKMGMRQLAHFGMGLALATGLAATAQTATHTTITAETREVNGKTVATFTATVLDADGAPASGVVTLVEHGRNLSAAALDTEGKTQIALDGLTEGDHTLRAVYSGNGSHAASHSESLIVHPEASATPDFALDISETTMNIAAPGGAGTLIATITPANGFTGFISLSCSGPPTATSLPVGVSCTFAPANLQVSSASAVTADLSIQTTAPAGQHIASSTTSGTHATASPIVPPIVLAVLLPGVVGLGFLGRKRKLFGRVVLLLLVGVISVAGTTACSARYRYLNHPPTYNGGTLAGSYTILVTAQTSNGVTASSHSQTLALTVQ